MSYREWMWATRSEYELQGVNVGYKKWIWAIWSEYELQGVNVGYREWMWGTRSEYELYGVNMSYREWMWGTESECRLQGVNMGYGEWIRESVWATRSEYVLQKNLAPKSKLWRSYITVGFCLTRLFFFWRSLHIRTSPQRFPKAEPTSTSLAREFVL